jgi:ATP-binding protein involved in chromosome partitioning
VTETDLRYEPEDMEVDLSKGLTITWADGVTTFISSRFLRLKSTCAQWREYTKGRTPEQLEIIYDTVPKDITITDAKEMGNYALGIMFSDNHKSGIFEFHHLRKIGEEFNAVAAGGEDV